MSRICIECNEECTEDDSDCCLSCGGDLKVVSSSSTSNTLIVVGIILSCESIVGKDKLKVLLIDIGHGEPI